MKHASLTFRLTLTILIALILIAPATAAPATAQAEARTVMGPQVHVLQGNKLFDYIRGNRSRMVQIATIALGIGLVILMTATRKN